MKQAALYARVSSDQQTEARTIQSQIAEVLERIRSDQLSVPEELKFIDDGYSGATLIRPALERMRDAAYNGAIDVLYVLSPDRLARKYAYQILLVDEFRRAGVELVFLHGRNGDTPEDELLLQVQGIVSEYERAKFLERSRRGRLHNARRGSVSVFGAAPYGYHYISKKVSVDGDAHYEINFEEARVVKQIFSWVGKDRLTLSEVCRRLAAAGIKTQKGKTRWHTKTISDMLRNPAYTGQAAFGRTKSGPRRPELRRPSKLYPEQRQQHSSYKASPEDWIHVAVPALVPQAVFDTVQEQLAENRKTQRARVEGARHLLQGLTGCKLCGHAYYGIPVWCSKGNKEYVYYQCIGSDAYRHGGTRICDNKRIRADLLEKAVWDEVVRLMQNPGYLEEEYKRRLAAGEPDDFTSLQNEQLKLKNAIARMIDGYADGVIEKKEFEPRIKRTRAKLVHLESQLKKATEEAEADRQLQLLIVQFGEFSSKVLSNLQTVDWQTKRAIIRALIKRIDMDRNSVNVTFRIGDMLNLQSGAG